MKTQPILLAFILVLAAPIVTANAYDGDVVYLKDGSVLLGTVLDHSPGGTLEMRSEDGNLVILNMDEVKRVNMQAQDPQQTATTSYQTVSTNHDALSTSHNASSPASYRAPSQKSPATAFLLSFLIPGLGQFYNGQPGKGAVQLGLFVGGLGLAFGAGYTEERISYGWDYDPGGYYSSGFYNYDVEYVEYLNTFFYVGAGIALGAAIWSMIDAPLSASKINKENLRFGHLMEFETGDKVVGFDLAQSKAGLGANISLHF